MKLHIASWAAVASLGCGHAGTDSPREEAGGDVVRDVSDSGPSDIGCGAASKIAGSCLLPTLAQCEEYVGAGGTPDTVGGVYVPEK